MSYVPLPGTRRKIETCWVAVKKVQGCCSVRGDDTDEAGKPPQLLSLIAQCGQIDGHGTAATPPR